MGSAFRADTWIGVKIMYVIIRVLLKDDTPMEDADKLGRYMAQHIKENVPSLSRSTIGKVYYRAYEGDGTV
jgi:hypothetical protein